MGVLSVERIDKMRNEYIRKLCGMEFVDRKKIVPNQYESI